MVNSVKKVCVVRPNYPMQPGCTILFFSGFILLSLLVIPNYSNEGFGKILVKQISNSHDVAVEVALITRTAKGCSTELSLE